MNRRSIMWLLIWPKLILEDIIHPLLPEAHQYVHHLADGGDITGRSAVAVLVLDHVAHLLVHGDAGNRSLFGVHLADQELLGLLAGLVLVLFDPQLADGGGVEAVDALGVVAVGIRSH